MSSDWHPTREEREWIARERARDPKLTEALLRSQLEARHHRIEREARERAEAAEARTTVEALRWARRQLRQEAALDRARAAVREVVEPADPEWDLIVAAFKRWTGLEKNADKRMTLADMTEEADLGRDKVVRVCRRHGVNDFRLLGARLRELGIYP